MFGHTGEVGNEGADQLANMGTRLPPEPDRHWNTLERNVRENGLPFLRMKVYQQSTAPSTPARKKLRVEPPAPSVTSIPMTGMDVDISQNELEVSASTKIFLRRRVLTDF